MKLTFLFICLTFILPAYSQTTKSDTIFLLKDKAEGTSQSIFIDPSNKSAFYNQLTNLEVNKSISYDYSLNYLIENHLQLEKVGNIIPFNQWISLKKYRGEYYVYKPCDWYTRNDKSINDSTFIDFTGEGPIANKIILQKKINPTTFQYELTGIYHKERTLTIYIVDQKKGIALFETSDYHSEEKEYELFVSAEKIHLFPLIVNQCEFHKQHEFFFDTPDFKQILLQVKK